jgi:dTDP-glucose 4,6-dehydratase
MKLLVTGGAGFIGANFVDYWLESNPADRLIVLDALTYAGNKRSLRSALASGRVEFVKGNIRNAKLVDRLTARVDLVVHFAAESHVDRSISGPGEFVRTNVLGTQVLLDAAVKHRVRFHHISTDEVYGSLARNSRLKFSETSLYDPRSPYAASKAASDHLVRAYGVTYGLRYTLTNCSNNYGPWQHPEKLIPKAILNLESGKKVPLYGDGGQKRDWLYVTDHCRAVELVIKKGRPAETYLVGGQTEEISNKQLIKKILKLMGKGEEMIEYVEDRAGHDQKYAVDWSKLKKLGYQPQVDLESGLRQTIAWYLKRDAFLTNLV